MNKTTDRSLPYLICELANTHAGDAAAVEELIDAFAGLDYAGKAIKFQVFGADTIALPDFPWYGVYQQLEFDPATWSRFFDRASAHGDVWVDAFDVYGIEIIGRNLNLIAGVKLQSSVLENEEVLSALRMIDLSSKSLLINVSGFDLDQISGLVDVFRTITERLVLQIGFQGYPTAIEDTALQKIPILRAAFPDLQIGMADHADAGSDFAQLAPVYAYLAGCSSIEKHFCLNRAEAKYDGYSALQADEMQRLCHRLADLAQARHGLFVSASEQNYLEKSVQVPVLRVSQLAGSQIPLRDLMFRRTAQKGISWPQIHTLQSQGMILSGDRPALGTISAEHFRPAQVACIVACRMKSSRLPRKAILPIAGISSVERCLYQCLSTQGVGQVILATSTLDEDAVLSEHLCSGAVRFWAGDPDDVISRYVGACDHHGVDVVVRVTADCPLVSSEILETLLDSHFHSGADYTAATNAAVGTAGEVINASALRLVIERLGRAPHSEYMTWYFRNNPELFRINLVDLPRELVRNYRLTLDHPEDLQLFEAVLAHLEPKTAYTLAEVFGVLDSHPEIAALNAHIELKYVVDQELIAMLNEKTRIPPHPDAKR
ncbi:MAG: N-acetylneuraminate synthase family protein [Xanthomonadales bacterium]|nr:N-acetylneuraminate synthase family protein [Xanthomonadales bacterium]